MFSPVEKDYYNLLNSKPFIETNVKPGLDDFPSNIRNKISELFSSLLECEKCYEKWRLKFYHMQTFTSKYIFQKIDTYAKNYISSFDVFFNNYRLKKTVT